MQERNANFWIGNVPIFGDAILSPMAGYSDVPYRSLCRAYGSAMNYTEFVPVEGLLGKKRNNRFWQRLDTKSGEYPVIFQIFGNNAQKILNAALRIETLQPDIIDVNMGCSTRRVSGRGAGVGMMPQPELVAETFRLLSAHLNVPVTGKIRLGWNHDQRNYADIAHIMEDNGAAMIAMHARTKVQKYGGRADWQAIGELRAAVNVPVLGNGDVKAPADIERMKQVTGCDAVLIGRAAIGNPWIFARKEKTELSRQELLQGIKLHAREMVSYYGERQGVLLFRKHLKQYLADMGEAEPMLPGLLQASQLEELMLLLEQLAYSADISR
ncbi:MAG: tRNA dihydrouridine synthase [Candidatus Promineifilaceae bacterium]